MFRTYLAVVGAGVLLAAQMPRPTRPEVPKSLQAPAGEEVLLVAHAKGTQIYKCKAGADQKFTWALKGPEAELKMVAKEDAPKVEAPKPGAIPWLLLKAVSHTGEGIFSRVTSIQRIHTEGGLPPEANSCDASARDTESNSAYSADYYFYEAPTPKNAAYRKSQKPHTLNRHPPTLA